MLGAGRAVDARCTTAPPSPDAGDGTAPVGRAAVAPPSVRWTAGTSAPAPDVGAAVTGWAGAGSWAEAGVPPSVEAGAGVLTPELPEPLTGVLGTRAGRARRCTGEAADLVSGAEAGGVDGGRADSVRRCAGAAAAGGAGSTWTPRAATTGPGPGVTAGVGAAGAGAGAGVTGAGTGAEGVAAGGSVDVAGREGPDASVVIRAPRLPSRTEGERVPVKEGFCQVASRLPNPASATPAVRRAAAR
ncbi:hypothetical protein ABZ330_20920 [Streptomyces sp. NPDC006172]|uniref:hypothetical protein n=1 Tax=Streptomyces sp. NPDC006172 TaxID=3154470 RepID=UPI00340AF5EC